MTTTNEDASTIDKNIINESGEPISRSRTGSLSLKGRPQTPPKLIDGNLCFENLADRPPTPPADVEELELFDLPERGYRVHDESSLSVYERKWLISEDFAHAMRFTPRQRIARGSDMVVDTVMEYVEEQRKCSFGYFQEANGFQIAPTTDATDCDIKFYTISSKNRWSLTAPFKRLSASGSSKLDIAAIRVRVEGEWFRVTDLLNHLYSDADWTRHKYRLYQRETWVYGIEPHQEMLKAQRNWWDSNGKHFRFIELPIEIQKRVCKVGLGVDHDSFIKEMLHGTSKAKGWV